MRKKNDINIFIGVAVLVVIIIIGIVGFKSFGRSVAVPQIGDMGQVTNTDVNALPVDTKLSNKKNEDTKMEPIQVIKKENGLIIEITKEGTGNQVHSGDTVSVDYRGMFTNGTVFDESYKRGQQFSFTVGAGQVIAGWEEGVLGMKVGEIRHLTIPSSLAYGPNDYGPIPGGSTLVFDIELHKIGK